MLMLMNSLSFIFMQWKVDLQDWSQREIFPSSFENFSQESFSGRLLAACAYPSGFLFDEDHAIHIVKD